MKCDKCSLHEFCKTGTSGQEIVNCLDGTGSKNSKIMIVGLNPKNLETRAGSSEAMLDQKLRECLDSAGLNKESFYFTYLVKCRTSTKENTDGKVIFNKPKVKELRECIAHLEEEISEIKPNVIILLGETVTQFVLNEKSVKNIHGTPFWHNKYKTTCIPLFDIGVVKNARDDMATELAFINDLLVASKASSTKQFIEKERMQTKYIVCDNIDKFRVFTSKLKSVKNFVFDIETTGLNPDSSDLLCIAFSCKEGSGVVIPLREWFGSYTEAKIEVGLHELVYEEIEVIPEGKRKPVVEKIFAGTMCYELNNYWNIEENKEVYATLKEIFSLKDIEMIAHNIAFDVCYLNSKLGIDIKGKYYDTMLAEYLFNPESREGRSLEDMAWRYTDMGGYDDGLKSDRKTGFRDVNPNELYHYANCDADCTLRIYNKQKDKVKPFLELLQNILAPLSIVIREMEYTGITIDIDKVKREMIQYENNIEKHEKSIYELEDVKKYIKVYEDIASKPFKDKWDASTRIQKTTPNREDYVSRYMKPFNISSTTMLRGLLFDYLKLPVNSRTDSKLPSTNEAALQALHGKHPVLDSLLDLRHLKKIYSTYLKPLPDMVDRNNKIHTSFRADRTATGRLASSKPNLQNIPKKKEGKQIRDNFIASEGNYLLESDLRQIEFRVLAHFVGDEKMLEDIKQGLDIHRELASEIYHVAPDKVTDQQRSNSKSVTFGIPYGRSAVSLAAEFNMDIEEAEAFIRAFFNRYPSVEKWINKQIGLAEKRGYVKTYFGRIRYLPKIKDMNDGIRNSEIRKVVATIIQGTANDILSIYTINIRNRLIKESLNAKLVLSVHDAVFLDCPKEEIQPVLRILKEEMERPIEGIRAYIETEVQVGFSWGALKVFEHWHKIFQGETT